MIERRVPDNSFYKLSFFRMPGFAGFPPEIYFNTTKDDFILSLRIRRQRLSGAGFRVIPNYFGRCSSTAVKTFPPLVNIGLREDRNLNSFVLVLVDQTAVKEIFLTCCNIGKKSASYNSSDIEDI